MKKFALIGLLIGGLGASIQAKGQVPILRFDQLESILTRPSDTTYVVNFWATWCAPCVEELPLFERLHAEIQHRKAKVLLVSMDFQAELQTVVLPFLKRRDLQCPVVLLNEPDYNAWINRIEPSWQGGIPATLVLNNARKYRSFFAQRVSYDLIMKELEKSTDAN
jgi:thiol-disulfide isomerase/thioredoxin